MKKVILFFLFVIVLCTLKIEDCLSQWSLQSSGVMTTLRSVFFANNNTGWVVGDSGTVLKSTNSGSSWVKLLNGTIINFGGVRFINAYTGWCVGDSGIILKTTNGGTNWNVQNGGTASTLRSVFFIDSYTGWIVGDSGTVLKTSDIGFTWVRQSGLPVIQISSVYFIDVNTGWLACSGTIYKTTNSGVNWVNENVSTPRSWRSVFFVNPDTGWITGSLYSLRKSIDGGTTWVNNVFSNITEPETDNEDSPPATYTCVYFINQNTGWYTRAHSFGGSINKTINGGQKWSLDFPNLWKKSLFSIRFNDENNGWAVGAHGTILYTNNGGSSNYYYMSGTVKYTDNNQLVTSGLVKAIKLNSVDASILVLDSALIQPDGTYLMSHIPQDSLYIGLYPNSGSTPDYLISYYPSTLDWMQATVLYPTGNLTNINLGAIRVQNTDENNSVNGKVYRLTDAVSGNLKDAVLYARNGNTYVRCAVSDVNGDYHIQSISPGNLKIIVNRLGFTGDSTDVNLTSTGNIDSINFYLYRYPPTLTGIRQITGEIPIEFKLYQNYPNPFNPTTKIKFDIPSEGQRHAFDFRDNANVIQLKIYNITGREITTLINESLQPGTYEVTFDASNLSSGIYFYRIQTENFSDTKRMLFIK